MQRVANCILTNGDQVLMLKKPSRGWWVAPGGKMESGENVRESVTREFYEETGITLKNPQLRGIFTMLIEDKGKIINEWMMFTFHEVEYEGKLLEESPEGKLSWHCLDTIFELPMTPGDYHIFKQVLKTNKMIYGTFSYTKDYKLISYQLDIDGESPKKYHVHSL